MSEQRGEARFAVGGRLVGVVVHRWTLLLEIPVKVTVVVMEKVVLRFEERQASEGGMCQW